jgi:hypothetical protein
LALRDLHQASAADGQQSMISDADKRIPDE